jgi:salicylate hydroxylase
MEDAIVLARELAAASSIAAGLAAFDRERQPRSGKLAKTETANRDAKTAGRAATRMRELIMPHVFDRFYEKATSWLYEYDPGRLPSGDERNRMARRAS